MEHNNKNKTTVTSDHFFLDELWGSSSNCPHGKDLVEFHEYLAREVLGVNRSMLVDASNYDILGDGGSDYVDIQSVVYYSILKQEPGLKSYYSLFG